MSRLRFVVLYPRCLPYSTQLHPGSGRTVRIRKGARASLVDERNREAGTLAALKAERASLAAQSRRIETEAAPIRYVAELVGADTDSERAIRWLICLMVLTCDPLAIALTAAASAKTFRDYRSRKLRLSRTAFFPGASRSFFVASPEVRRNFCTASRAIRSVLREIDRCLPPNLLLPWRTRNRRTRQAVRGDHPQMGPQARPADRRGMRTRRRPHKATTGHERRDTVSRAGR
jgi:hypothetical protein